MMHKFQGHMVPKNRQFCPELSISGLLPQFEFTDGFEMMHRWSLGMDKLFHPKLNGVCDYWSMMVLKLNHVSNMGLLVSQGKKPLPEPMLPKIYIGLRHH